MDHAEHENHKLTTEAEYARLHLLKGEHVSRVEHLLEQGKSTLLPAGSTLDQAKLPANSLLILLSGRLEYQSATAVPPLVITAGDYIGGMHFGPVDNLPPYKAFQDCRLLVLDEKILVDLADTSHAIARNLMFLALHQLKHQGASHDDLTTRPDAINDDDCDKACHLHPLTGLHTDTWLENALTRQIIRSRSQQRPLSVMALEIDGLGKYRKEFGKTAAEQALKSVASLSLKLLRPDDIVAHVSKNRIVISLPGTSTADASIPAERLREAIAAHTIEIPGECVLPPVTVTIGITELKAMVSANKLVDDAIETLVQGQARGNNHITAA